MRRLRLERIDLYQLHIPDPYLPLCEFIGALNALRSEGKIRHIGVSNVTPEQLAVARTITDIATVQNRLNLANSDWHNMLIGTGQSTRWVSSPTALSAGGTTHTRTSPDGSRLPARRKHQSDRPRLVTRSLSRHTCNPRKFNRSAPRRQPCCGVASTRARRDTCDHRGGIESDVAGHSCRCASTSQSIVPIPS